MKKTTKDIMRFGASSVMVGGLGIASSAVGGGSGVAAASSFMPTIGSLSMSSNVIRMSTKLLPKKKKGLF